jgi:hypothetical protein
VLLGTGFTSDEARSIVDHLIDNSICGYDLPACRELWRWDCQSDAEIHRDRAGVIAAIRAGRDRGFVFDGNRAAWLPDLRTVHNAIHCIISDIRKSLPKCWSGAAKCG